MPPIFQAATFAYQGEDSYDAVRYTRCNNNPSQLAVAAQLAALEGAEVSQIGSEAAGSVGSSDMQRREQRGRHAALGICPTLHVPNAGMR